jgi:hypothetical protein
MRTAIIAIALFFVGCGAPGPLKIPDGYKCAQNEDCFSGLCLSALCVPSTCQNGTRDPQEADVDCGTACFKACMIGQMCIVRTDCEVKVGATCLKGFCYPGSCADNQKNGSETDVDCGGNDCPKCDEDGDCTVNSDCESDCCRDGRINTCAPSKVNPGICLP